MITNGCSEMPIWIDNYAAGYTHVAGIENSAKISPLQSRRFPMNATGAAYYPKFGCNASGKSCASGDGGSKPRTLFEFTWPAYGDGDAYDMSLVDGWNLPFKLKMVGCQTTNPLSLPKSSEIDCSTLTMADCPTSEILGGVPYNLSQPASGQRGCMAPCFQQQFSQVSATSAKAEQYCCQNSYASPKCRNGDILRTQWFKRMRAKCRRAYLYPLDDPEGNQGCASPHRSYHLTFFCPAHKPDNLYASKLFSSSSHLTKHEDIRQFAPTEPVLAYSSFLLPMVGLVALTIVTCRVNAERMHGNGQWADANSGIAVPLGDDA